MTQVQHRQDQALKAKLFRGLSDPSRLGILECLREGPRHVGAVVESTGLTQSNVSMHLECLFCCGLVERERKGRRVYYRIRSRRILRLLTTAEDALAEVGGHIAACGRYRGATKE